MNNGTASAGGALRGIRIADFTQLYQGPLATQILGDLGAEVIKIEPPKGDFMRGWSLGDFYPGGESVSFLSVNRNKRSLALDLKQERGREVARRVIASADVVIENFRPGVMDRLGLGCEVLSASDPRLVYCASSGYGQTGPYRDLPGQDLLIQALGGTMWLNGRRTDPPTAVGFGIADITAGFHIVYGVLAALFERQQSGLGQRVDVNLLNALLVVEGHELVCYANSGQAPVRPLANTTAVYAGAPLGVYQTADGYIALAMMSISFIAGLVEAPELEGETGSNNVPHRDRIHALLEARFRTAPLTHWLKLLQANDVWCAPVQTFDQVVVDPQVSWNRMIQEVAHPTAGNVKVLGPAIVFERTPATIRRAPPLFGQHTCEVLTELGYSEHELGELIASRAAIQAQTVAVPAVGVNDL